MAQTAAVSPTAANPATVIVQIAAVNPTAATNPTASEIARAAVVIPKNRRENRKQWV